LLPRSTAERVLTDQLRAIVSVECRRKHFTRARRSGIDQQHRACRDGAVVRLGGHDFLRALELFHRQRPALHEQSRGRDCIVQIATRGVAQVDNEP
jgi:hypothetical protein